MRRISRIGLWGGAALAALAPAIGAILSTVGGRDVILISPHDPSIVEMNRLLWTRGEKVPDLYGVPSDRAVRILFPKKSSLIVPEEDPSLALLKVDKQAGENPLQARTLWFGVKATIFLGVLLVLGGAIFRILPLTNPHSGTAKPAV